jgi:hypothetical protein
VKRPPPADSAGIPRHQVLFWCGVAVAVGVALRSLPLSKDAIPILVGLGVTTLVVFLCWQFVLQPDEPRQKSKKGSRAVRRPQARSLEKAKTSNEVSEN